MNYKNIPRNPSGNKQKTQGANARKRRVITEKATYVCKEDNLTRSLEEHNKIDAKYDENSQPKFHINCIETILEWIDKQEFVIGMQMNFTHPDILKKLCSKEAGSLIITQYQPWMDNA